jgi:hypothetical protein
MVISVGAMLFLAVLGCTFLPDPSWKVEREAMQTCYPNNPHVHHLCDLVDYEAITLIAMEKACKSSYFSFDTVASTCLVTKDVWMIHSLSEAFDAYKALGTTSLGSLNDVWRVIVALFSAEPFFGLHVSLNTAELLKRLALGEKSAFAARATPAEAKEGLEFIQWIIYTQSPFMWDHLLHATQLVCMQSQRI